MLRALCLILPLFGGHVIWIIARDLRWAQTGCEMLLWKTIKEILLRSLKHKSLKKETAHTLQHVFLVGKSSWTNVGCICRGRGSQLLRSSHWRWESQVELLFFFYFLCICSQQICFSHSYSGNALFCLWFPFCMLHKVAVPFYPPSALFGPPSCLYMFLPHLFLLWSPLRLIFWSSYLHFSFASLLEVHCQRFVLEG